MRYISANYIFDGKDTFLKNGIVTINADGVVQELEDTGGVLDESENIEFYNGIIVPGFINTHCHLELSHEKGKIPQGVGLPNFIKMANALRSAPEPTKHAAMHEALSHMKAGGIVAVGDISNDETSFRIKQKSNLYFYTFLECFGLNNSTDNLTYELACGFYEKWRGEIPLTITPHAPYSCSPWLLGKINIFQEKHREIFSFHNQECAEENELFLNKSGELFDVLSKSGMDLSLLEYEGLNSMQTTSKYFPQSNNKIMVHNTFTSEADINFLNEGFDPDTFYWCLCPNSNLYIENKLPDIDMFYKRDLQCVIGTDSLASNTTLSILDELKTITNHFDIPLAIMLRWACYNGAKALQVSTKIGSFNPGLIPGVNLLENVDLQKMKLLPETRVKVLA